MTSIINIHDAKTHLSRLVDRAAAGDDIVIARAGKPIARLTKIEAPDDAGPRKPGMFADIKISDSFFDPLSEDELAAWE
jgi:prevent-host-death family protein